MATAPRTSKDAPRKVHYPTRDGKPMAETELHAKVMVDLMQTLGRRYADDPMVYVWGNLLMFYEEGNGRKHLSPDVFVVLGVPKLPPRDHYLIWREGKPPDFVVEVTSKTTRVEDQTRKLALYRDVLKVPEYFQFDPTEDYLDPAFQGFRLVEGEYRPIEPVAGRLPSEVLGLHLERDGASLRLHDPATGRWLPTTAEVIQAAKARARRPRPAPRRPRSARDGRGPRRGRCRRERAASSRDGRTSPPPGRRYLIGPCHRAPTSLAAADSVGAAMASRRWAITASESIPSASAWKVVTIRCRNTGNATWRMSATVAWTRPSRSALAFAHRISD